MIGRAEKNGPQGSGISGDVSFTLNTADRHAVAFCEKAAVLSSDFTYSSSKASFFTEVSEERANTLVATDYKNPPIVNDEDAMGYIVRRRMCQTAGLPGLVV